MATAQAIDEKRLVRGFIGCPFKWHGPFIGLCRSLLRGRRLLLFLFQLFEFHLEHFLFLRLGEFEIQQGNLEPHAPGRRPGRVLNVAKELKLEVRGLEANLHDSAETASERQRQIVAVAGSPIGGDDGRGGDVPAILHVVVNEVLKQKLIDRRTAAATGKRPYIVGESADNPVTGSGKNNHTWARADFSRSEEHTSELQ